MDFLVLIAPMLSPTAVLIGFVGVAVKQYYIDRKLADLTTMLMSMQVDRRQVESILHGRVTNLSDRVSHIEGWRNGQDAAGS